MFKIALIGNHFILNTLQKKIEYEINANVYTINDFNNARVVLAGIKPHLAIVNLGKNDATAIRFIKEIVTMHKHTLPVMAWAYKDDCYFDLINSGVLQVVFKLEKQETLDPGIVSDQFMAELKLFLQQIKYSDSLFKLLERDRVLAQSASEKLIAIGSSTGGTEAVLSILKKLPFRMPPIVITQHMPPVFTKLYSDRLNDSCKLFVKEAQKNDELRPGAVLLAPGDYHMKVVKTYHRLMVDCYQGEKVSGHRPSVDVLFDSVAAVAGKSAIGVILTGMGADGANGLKKMLNSGARTIGQDKTSSIVYGMPKVAYEIGAVQTQASLSEIPKVICDILENRI